MSDQFDTAQEAAGGAEVKRDRWGRYLLPKFSGDFGPVKRGGKESGYTRATTFAKSISDTYTLSQWGQRMVAKGLAMRPDLYALAAATPLEERDVLNDIAERAKEHAGAKGAASLGTALHTFTEQVDRGETPAIPEPWAKDVAAYTALMDAAGLKVIEIERIVFNDYLGVAGTFDRLVVLTRPLTVKIGDKEVTLDVGTVLVLDLKTGRDLTYGWGEISIQLGVYAKAAAMWDPSRYAWEPMPAGLSDRVALVVHLPVGEARAELHAVNISKGWQAADLCEMVRNWRKVKGLAAPVAIGEPERVHAPTWEDRIGAARTKADLAALWQEAQRAGVEWTDEYARLAERQLSKVFTA